MLITRGFGTPSSSNIYINVPVCDPTAISHEHGKKYMVGQEFEPSIRASIEKAPVPGMTNSDEIELIPGIINSKELKPVVSGKEGV